jgi:hypothetical protein
MVIAGLCECPLTFQAIIIWRDELNEGKVLLRFAQDCVVGAERTRTFSQAVMSQSMSVTARCFSSESALRPLYGAF